MELKDRAGWEKGLACNQDPYGRAIFVYAERWADLMEAEIAKGVPISECAERASHEADTEGLTGFMYGAAVSILSQAWKYGEELRRWHNVHEQIGNEGEKANESGGVLNPALLNIGTK